MEDYIKKTYVRTDRNGTKYYDAMVKCDRCSGRGWYAVGVRNMQLVPSPVDNAVCYQCIGKGYVMRTIKEYTPEHAEKLRLSREARAQKKAEEREKQAKAQREEQFAKWKRNNGFSEDGMTYIFLGNTYAIKDTIKEMGGKYCPECGWHIDHPEEGFEYIAVSFSDVCWQDNWGNGTWVKGTAYFNDLKTREYEKLHPTEVSQYVGNVGDKFLGEVTLLRIAEFETNNNYLRGSFWNGAPRYVYSGTCTKYIYTFKDNDGNLIIWKTTCVILLGDERNKRGIQSGDKVWISGRIKEHDIYRNEKQTVLTRCKIQERDCTEKQEAV